MDFSVFGMNMNMGNQNQNQNQNPHDQNMQDYKNFSNAGMGGMMALSRMAAEEEARNGNPQALEEQRMFEQTSMGMLNAQHNMLDNAPK